MSGDAQPRKRKNKGKKKGDQAEIKAEFIKERSGFRKSGLSEDSGDEEVFTPLKSTTDEVIHVHKDIGCGGNVVTKLIFFGILATIGVMVGVILLEYRGTTDEDTVSAVDSPWSVTLENWVDKEADTHHDEYIEADEEHGHDEHDHDEHGHDDHEDEGGHDEHDDGGHDEHDDGSHDEHDDGSHSDGEEGGGILSWFGFGGGESTVDEEPAEVEGGGGLFSFDTLSEILPFGKGGDNAGEEEETEVEGGGGWFGLGGSSDQDDSSGGIGSWFGFGGGEKESDNSEQEEEVEGSHEETEDGGYEEEYENEEKEEYEEEEEEEDEEEKEEYEEEEEEEDQEEEEIDEPEQQEEEEEEDEPDSLEEISKHRSYDISEEEEEEEDDDDYGRDNLSEPEEEEEEEKDKEEEDEGIGNDNISEEGEEDEDHDDLKEEEEDEDEGYNEKEDSVEQEDDEREDDEPDDTQSEEEPNEEELFPEAREALRREREELAKMKAEVEKEVEKEIEVEEKEREAEDEGFIESGNEALSEEGEEETEGMALKFGVGVALVVVAHVVLVKKWNSWAGEDAGEFMSETPPVTEQKVEAAEEPVIREAEAAPASEPPAHHPPSPTPAYQPPPPASPPVTPSPEPDEESPDEEEISEGGEEEESEVEIDKDKFKELIAKYGQDTPESSDIEQSDDDAQKYSEGEVSAGDEAEDSPAEVVTEDEQVPSEDELKEWTGIKKSDIEKITKLDSESEGGEEESEGEEEEEEEEEEESEDEPPPPPPPQTSRQRGGPRDSEEIYANDMITNEEDWAIRQELDRANEEFNYEKAHILFRELLEKHPNSPRARFGIAQSLDRLAEKRQSNKLLDVAIESYRNALEAPQIPELLFIKVANRLINRLRFRGQYLKAVEVQKQLVQKFDSTPEYQVEMGISYLMVNDLENARVVLKEVLKKWPEDPNALSHYGLVLKLQGNIHGCIKFLEKGLSDDFTAIKDARLYFHLGDALTRVGRESDALKVYDKGVAYGLFRSRYQRSLYNVDHLTGRPWWTHEQTTYTSFFKLLEENWLQIRMEGEKALKLNGIYRDEAESLTDKGDWKQFELFARGSEIKANCKVAPFTCSLIRSFEPAATCKRGQSKFSVMEGGTHVWPHCGPTNSRLRAHLGLIVPEGPLIRVADIKKKWMEGKVIIFDDSFEHEVWHNGTSLRLVLIVDVWHPELTREEKKILPPI